MATVVAVAGGVSAGISALRALIEHYGDLIKMGILNRNGDKDADKNDKDIVAYEGTKNTTRLYACSDKAAAIFRDAQNHLLSGFFQYRQSKVKVSTCCKMLIPILEKYMLLLEGAPIKDDAQTQNFVVLLESLNAGKACIREAVTMLEETRCDFQMAFVELTGLERQLGRDFDEQSKSHAENIKRKRKGGYGGAAAGVGFGLIGLAISYSIAAGVIEGHLVPKIRQEYRDAKQNYIDQCHSIRLSRPKFDSAHECLLKERDLLHMMEERIENIIAHAQVWKINPPSACSVLRKSITCFIEMCKGYVGALEELRFDSTDTSLDQTTNVLTW